jgi:hypothetical protein
MEGMRVNSRERFRQIGRFERKNDPFFWGLDAWLVTFRRWQREGMPVGSLESKKPINMHFLGRQNQFECVYPNACIKGMGACNNPPWVPPLEPMFERDILAREGNIITCRDYDGTIVRVQDGDPESMPQYLEFPVTDKKSWDVFKKRLDPFSPGRFPKGWDLISDANCQFDVNPELRGQPWAKRDFPLGIMALSLLGMPRNYMGIENLSYAIYDQPALVEEMIEWQTYYSMEVIKQVLKAGVTLDWAIFWEDICYNRGPLVSPAYIRKHMSANYRKVVDLLRSGGVEVICLDCDGLIDDLLPIWVDSGVNAIFPFECAAGMDALKVRKQYGKNLVIVGNVDKRALAAGKKEIDEQVQKVKLLIKDGGYYVNCDHHVPPDVSYENVVYWVNEINKLCDDPALRRVIPA